MHIVGTVETGRGKSMSGVLPNDRLEARRVNDTLTLARSVFIVVIKLDPRARCSHALSRLKLFNNGLSRN